MIEYSPEVARIMAKWEREEEERMTAFYERCNREREQARNPIARRSRGTITERALREHMAKRIAFEQGC